jgi:hypothetical protein
MNLLLWGLLAFVVIGIIGVINDPPDLSSPPPAPAVQAMPSKDEVLLARAAQGASSLKKAMRNPASFDLSQVLAMKDGAVCYEYRAQNGFGGFNVERAVLSPKGKFKGSDDEGFAGLWNRECAGKTGDDQTANVKLLLKYAD